jgi:hypothetical protein
VFISRSSHDQIVTLYETRLDEQKRHYEARLAHIEGELSFYRNAWLERLGLKFPIPRPAEVTAISPLAPVTVPSEREERKTFRLDKSEWSLDDRDWYNDYHVADAIKEGKPQDELEYWYYQYYGNRKPLEVFINRPFTS